MRILVYALLGIAVVATAVSLTGFNVDLWLAGLFFDRSVGKFVGQTNPGFGALRENGYVAVATAILVATLGLARLMGGRLPGLPPRTAIALLLSLLIGPGLLVNGILKPYGGRPRPAEVSQFGGPLSFVEWWNLKGDCDNNCSFMSGEAATAAWMFGPAMLVPPPLRVWALGAAGVFTVVVSVLRMAAGGHFFSDVLIGALTTILIILGMNRLLVGRRAVD